MQINSAVNTAINKQIGMESGAYLQYLAISTHFDVEGLSELAAFFKAQAEDELKVALDAAGKKVTAEQLAEMFRAADYDGGGDIDYSEFSDVIKGVKYGANMYVAPVVARRTPPF